MRSQTIIFFLLLVTLFFSLTTPSSNYLPRGSSLTVDHASSNLLISHDKTFTCGFYTSGANAYWFSIWFTNSKEKTLVWMANREKPINGRGSRLTLRKDGALVLTDLDGSIAWQTNTSSTIVERAELLNSGNLVLKDPFGKILWQSFDFPTDTLLPNQKFTKNTKLISRIAPLDFGPGHFSFFFDNDNVLRMIYDGPEISSIYWPNPDYTVYQNGRTNYNSTRVAILDDLGTFDSSDQLKFSVSDMGFGINRRLTMDYDGNLRVYSLDNSSKLWYITWEAVANQCEIHGLCGRNGICTYTPEPRCSCPPYHEPISSTDWTKGCKPKFNRSCSDSQFLEILHVDYYGFDINATQNISYEDCKQLCLGNCLCQAFKYRLTGDRMCFTKSALFNGYRKAESTNLYMRIPTLNAQTLEHKTVLNVSRLGCGGGEVKTELVLPNTYNGASKQGFKWVYLYSFIGAIGAIEALIFVVSWVFLFRKHGVLASLEEGYQTISSQFRSFSYGELKRATGKFKQVLGNGGFGAVYKGVLEDDREIAVKKLENIVQGEEEFWAEVSTFGRINHINLARMWGFCSQGEKRLLVYEFVQNGSLDKHLFSSFNDNTLLQWENRFKIALGIAKGLAYLHHECLEWVIHCDVKPENILLDLNFEPKILDFGLAKLCQRGGHGSPELSKIRGTKGYMAPEWTTSLPITAKVDVYSYGVVILELVTGIQLSSCMTDRTGKISSHAITQSSASQENPSSGLTDYHLGEEEIPELTSFVRLAKRKMQNGEDSWMEDLVDPRLEGKFSRKQAAMMIEIGISCVEDDRNKRPTMESVAQVLAECADKTAVDVAKNL